MKKVGARIKARREQLGMTVLELAEKIGVREATAFRYETGQIKNIKYDRLSKIAEALQVTPGYLLGLETKKIPLSDYPELKQFDVAQKGWIEVIKTAEDNKLTPEEVKEIIDLFIRMSKKR